MLRIDGGGGGHAVGDARAAASERRREIWRQPHRERDSKRALGDRHVSGAGGGEERHAQAQKVDAVGRRGRRGRRVKGRGRDRRKG